MKNTKKANDNSNIENNAAVPITPQNENEKRQKRSKIKLYKDLAMKGQTIIEDKNDELFMSAK